VTIKSCLIIFTAWLVLAMVLSASPVRQVLRFPTDTSTPVY
jgi:hypothetical protein